MENKIYQTKRDFLKQVFDSNDNQRDIQSPSLNPLLNLSKTYLKQLPQVETEVLFLNKSSFGIRPRDYNHVKSIGIENYLEEQLDYQSIDDSYVDDLIQTLYPLIDYSLPDLLTYINEGEAIGQDRSLEAATQLIYATMLRQIYSKRQLHEVMTEFWSNHFNVDISKNLVLFFKPYEDKHIIRANALTSFSEILKADSKSAAMMIYLDNNTSSKDGPNENYARELLELHTLGVNGGFDEDDVKNVARCFTGWSVKENDSDFFEFKPQLHDYGRKIVLGHEIQYENGIRDGEKVIELLIDNSTTASFIAQKLVKRFYSDSTNLKLVQAVAKSYISTDGDIKEMLRTLFHSPYFLDTVDSKFKRPIEFVSSLFRSIDSESQNFTISQKQRPLIVLVDEYKAGGQIPLAYAPPTGYPDDASYWNNSSSILRRINLANGVSLSNIRYTNSKTYAEYIKYDFNALIGDATTADEILDRLEDNLLFRKISNDDRLILSQFMHNDTLYIEEIKIRATIGILLSSVYFLNK